MSVEGVANFSERLLAPHTPEVEVLSSEEIYARLVNVCHLELSALTYLALTEDDQTSYDIAARILPKAPGDEVAKRSRQVKGHLDDIIIRVAGFADAEIDPNRMKGKDVSLYSLTPIGKMMQGVAFFMVSNLRDINKSEGGDFSLSDLFTKTTIGRSTKQEQGALPAQRRSAYRRARMIEVLGGIKEGETITDSQIGQKLKGVDQSIISTHVTSLKEAGIVDADSLNPDDRGKVVYKVIPGTAIPEEIKLVKGVPALNSLFLTFIKDQLRKNPTVEFDALSITESLHSAYVASGHTMTKQSFAHTVSKLLSLLRKNGNFTSTYSGLEHSHVQLTSTGRRVSDILTQVREACSNMVTAEGMQIYFASNVSVFFENYGENFLQRQAERGRPQETTDIRKKQIISFLLENVNGARAGVINKAVGRSVSNILSDLKAVGILEQKWSESQGRSNKSKHGSASLYTLSSRARQALIDNPTLSIGDLTIFMKLKKFNLIT